MDTKELRMGCYVYVRDNNKSDKWSVYCIDDMEFKSNGYGRICLYKNYRVDLGCVIPIPLTEEWLLKFGFVKDEEYLNRGAHCNYFTGLMRFKYCGSLGVWQFDVGTYEDLTMIKYVHQLQNLYFALTGEELEISDDKTKK